ncbi:hypothetical protein A5672_26770 [Mycobacterium alsense]|uniref:Uncharacterized protein n=1 Tax=Mycobacterium alsense TaxID=324058 RepID=A0ABD6NZ08_9MYCO|nr:Rv1535 family protein [Mycobacterium alsense]OBG31434.1 hypothetical protein A5672_26770 [Mycobacterium alsense]
MTAVLYDPEVQRDEVVTAAPAPKLTVVRDDAPPVPAPEQAAPRAEGRTIIIRDPLVDGAAHLLAIGVRHVYAALWRVGLLEVQA